MEKLKRITLQNLPDKQRLLELSKMQKKENKTSIIKLSKNREKTIKNSKGKSMKQKGKKKTKNEKKHNAPPKKEKSSKKTNKKKKEANPINLSFHKNKNSSINNINIFVSKDEFFKAKNKDKEVCFLELLLKAWC